MRKFVEGQKAPEAFIVRKDEVAADIFKSDISLILERPDLFVVLKIEVSANFFQSLHEIAVEALRTATFHNEVSSDLTYVLEHPRPVSNHKMRAVFYNEVTINLLVIFQTARIDDVHNVTEHNSATKPSN